MVNAPAPGLTLSTRMTASTTRLPHCAITVTREEYRAMAKLIGVPFGVACSMVLVKRESERGGSRTCGTESCRAEFKTSRNKMWVLR